MAKNPGPGQCVHCMIYSAERTWDHVFPLSWYPDTTPPNTEKWKIPSCAACNASYGALEETLLTRLALCLDPADARSAGIVWKALRALNPTQARDAKDRAMRHAKLEKIRRDLISGADIPMEGIYPGLDRTWDQPRHELTGITFPHDDIKRLTEKIVRGIYFIEDRKFIDMSYVIEFFALTDEGAKPVIDILDRAGTLYAREPGIVVRRAVAQDDKMASLFCIEIWGRIKMYATVMPSIPSDDPGSK